MRVKVATPPPPRRVTAHRGRPIRPPRVRGKGPARGHAAWLQAWLPGRRPRRRNSLGLPPACCGPRPGPRPARSAGRGDTQSSVCGSPVPSARNAAGAPPETHCQATPRLWEELLLGSACTGGGGEGAKARGGGGVFTQHATSKSGPAACRAAEAGGGIPCPAGLGSPLPSCLLSGPEAKVSSSGQLPFHSWFPWGQLSGGGRDGRWTGQWLRLWAPGYSIRHQSHRGKRLGSVKGLLLPQAAVPRTADGRCDARVRQPLVAWPGSDAGCRLSPEARGCSPHLTAGNSLTSESASAEVATSRLAAQVLGLLSLW